jgi:hypothetical protein
VVSGKSSVKSGSGCDSQGLYFTLVLPAMRSNYVLTPLVFNTNYYGLECLGGNNPVFAMPSAHTTYPLSFDTTFAFDHSSPTRLQSTLRGMMLCLLIADVGAARLLYLSHAAPEDLALLDRLENLCAICAC